MMFVKRLIVSLCALGMAVTVALAEPAKWPNSALDQRVLTRPAAVLHDAPEGTALSNPPVFSAYYVFERRDVGGTEWVRVGANRNGAETFWMKGERSVDWRQTIILSFTNPSGRLPTMFFDTEDDIRAFLKRGQTMSTDAETAAIKMRQGESVDDLGVLAVEPEEFVSLTDQFYMLPILQHRSVRVNRRPKKILEIASINLQDPPAQSAEASGPFKVGITFVIDTSMSMQPVIDQTLQAVETILASVQDTKEDVDYSFGLVGFRSDINAVPELGYRAKSYFDLMPEFDQAAFLAALRGMKATTISSHNFDEDGMSGLIGATKYSAWSEFDGRFIIYISDAGMLVGSENGAGSEQTPDVLGTRMWQDQQIATFALFLATRAGRAYHDDALAQLERLTQRDGGNASQVFSIENGDPDIFRTRVTELTESMIGAVRKAIVKARGQQGQQDPCASDPNSVACAVSDAGDAMILSWLGRQNQTQAPDTYRAWVADFALDDPRRRALAPRILLTRAQLNDLYVTLQAITEAFSQSEQSGPEEFFPVLKTVLARVLRDPGSMQSLDAGQTARIARASDFDDLGPLLGDYLGGLPYESDLTEITQDRWSGPAGLGASGRYDFIEGLKSKMAMYELYYADEPNWVAIAPDAVKMEFVYPIPLEMIP